MRSFKEASLLDTRKALRQARQHGRVNITQGTKGRRGKGSDRWIPVSNQWRAMTKQTTINGFHDMRAAYACERYQAITGYPAPVITGKRQADKALDQKARTILAQELGHNRTDVVAAISAVVNSVLKNYASCQSTTSRTTYGAFIKSEAER